MNKLEKVIKGLECHGNSLCVDANDIMCPYWNKDGCSSKLCKDVVALLKEQQAEIKRLKILVKKKNRKIKKLMEDNYLNGGR